MRTHSHIARFYSSETPALGTALESLIYIVVLGFMSDQIAVPKRGCVVSYLSRVCTAMW